VTGQAVDFYALGRDAHAAGMPSAPVLNEQVWAALEGVPVGDPRGMQVLRDYTRGWNDANLAAPVDKDGPA
jgi:hypothetical protein